METAFLEEEIFEGNAERNFLGHGLLNLIADTSQAKRNVYLYLGTFSEARTFLASTQNRMLFPLSTDSRTYLSQSSTSKFCKTSLFFGFAENFTQKNLTIKNVILEALIGFRLPHGGVFLIQNWHSSLLKIEKKLKKIMQVVAKARAEPGSGLFLMGLGLTGIFRKNFLKV